MAAMDRPHSTPESLDWSRRLSLERNDQAAMIVVLLLCQLWAVSFFLLQVGESPRQSQASADARQAVFQVDLNTASWPELATIPGLGEYLARSITQYRQSHGPFQHVDSLRNVDGIGPWRLEQMRPHLAPLTTSGALVQSDGPARRP